MLEILIETPLLLLFIVTALGYLVGRIRIAGASLNVAAVLFVGLAVGSIHPGLKLPEIVYLLGLALYVYTVGLSSGPGFFAAFRRKGLGANLLVAGCLLLSAGLATVAFLVLHLEPAVAAGMLVGSLTNTPALAALLEYIKGYMGGADNEALMALPVVGYSLAYPMGVIGTIVAIQVARRLFKVDFQLEARQLAEAAGGGRQLVNRTIRVTRLPEPGDTISALSEIHGWDVVFGRMKRLDCLILARGDTRLEPGDLVSVIGSAEEIERVTRELGEPTDERLELDRSELDFRRIFVSSSRIAGHTLKELNLPQQFGAVITRVRRGDVEFLPHGDTVLELGDRVRVVTRREHMQAVTDFFGDSYRALSEFDVLSFSLGLALGLLVGMIPVPLPGGVTLKLGFAGGPLVVALVLGRLERTGPILWNLSYSVNLTLRQIGIILFLAGIGTRAGYAFVSTLTGSHGLSIFLAGAVITAVTVWTALWVGYRVLRIPMLHLMGIVAGLQTQPAVLAFANEQAGSEAPNVGYATVYPVALVLKIVLAQVLLATLAWLS